ncbi:TIGR03668 family PPOX class F420-dependent oxidoreductase [Thalassiella azotivora]
MEQAEARRRFGAAPVARLATVRPDGGPHTVPVVVALDVDAEGRDVVVSAVDHKPKRATDLQRLRNVAAEPRVSLLVDHWDDDWSRLWWVRADGTGVVLPPDDPTAAAAVNALVARHAPYRARRPEGPVLVVSVRRWVGWSAQ